MRAMRAMTREPVTLGPDIWVVVLADGSNPRSVRSRSTRFDCGGGL